MKYVGGITMGKIIVIEGTDCSGKTTQFEKLCKRLQDENVTFSTASFPDYPSESSWFVRQYLSGEFGEHPSDVSAKTASVFYAVDRYDGMDALGNTYASCITRRRCVKFAIHRRPTRPNTYD